MGFWTPTRIVSLGSALLLGTGAYAQEVTITYSDWLPPNFFVNADVIDPWIAKVAEVTEGRVTVARTPKSVGPATQQFDVVRDGLADLSWISPGYTPGRFTLIEYGDLPLLGDDTGAVGVAIDRTYREHLADQNLFEGVVPLSIFTTGPLQILTKNREVDGLEDLAGLKLRSSGVAGKMVEAVGGIPLAKSAAEAYEMLSTGAIDGQTTTYSAVTSFNLLDLTDATFVIPGGLARSTVVWGINEAKWNSISEADREAILAITGEDFARQMGEAYDRADNAALQVMRDSGYDVVEASVEAVEELRATADPVEQAWITAAQEKGVANPQDILMFFRDTIEAEQPTN